MNKFTYLFVLKKKLNKYNAGSINNNGHPWKFDEILISAVLRHCFKLPNSSTAQSVFTHRIITMDIHHS